MTAKKHTNRTGLYLIALIVIIIAFLLLGGGPWLRGMIHGYKSLPMAYWNWTQILISLGIGFIIGLIAGRRR